MLIKLYISIVVLCMGYSASAMTQLPSKFKFKAGPSPIVWGSIGGLALANLSQRFEKTFCANWTSQWTSVEKIELKIGDVDYVVDVNTISIGSNQQCSKELNDIWEISFFAVHPEFPERPVKITFQQFRAGERVIFYDDPGSKVDDGGVRGLSFNTYSGIWE